MALGRNVRLVVPQTLTGLRDATLYVRVRTPEENVTIQLREVGKKVGAPVVRPAEMVRVMLKRDDVAEAIGETITISLEREQK